jgi:hypothetical protein
MYDFKKENNSPKFCGALSQNAKFMGIKDEMLVENGCAPRITTKGASTAICDQLDSKQDAKFNCDLRGKAGVC